MSVAGTAVGTAGVLLVSLSMVVHTVATAVGVQLVQGRCYPVAWTFPWTTRLAGRPCPGVSFSYHTLFLQARMETRAGFNGLSKVTGREGVALEAGASSLGLDLPAAGRRLTPGLPNCCFNETYFMEYCRWMTWSFFPGKLSAQIRLQGVTAQLEDVT